MCLNTIPGSSMARPSASGRGGTGIPDCTSGFPESRLVWALELGSLAGLAGDGDTGDSVGMAAGSCSTMAAGYLTAESSPTVASLTAPDFMEADFTEEADSTVAVDFMAQVARIPARSAALVMEVTPEAFPRVGNPASATEVEASTAAGVSTAAVVVGAGDSVQLDNAN